MSEADAKAAVEEEMKRRCAPNPWDAPGPRRSGRKPRRAEEVGGLESGEGSRYSEEQWDLFEGVLGYR